VFADPHTDQRLVSSLAGAAGGILLWAGVLAYRELSRVDPAPRLARGLQGPSDPNTP